MSKPTLSSYVREHGAQRGKKKEPGPYVTISRQYGCDGVAIGSLLVEKLNSREDEQGWKLHHRDLLERLSEDTGLDVEQIEKERLARPSFVKDILRGVKRSHSLDSFEIRNHISVMIRELAFDGRAVIIGHGGAASTSGLDHGLAVRVEASLEWRLPRICRSENLSRGQAMEKIREADKEREILMEYYKDKNPREPAFNIIIDNSIFNIEQIAEQILFAMEQKNLVKKAQ